MRKGWKIAQEYSDHAMSGATVLRPGFQAMMPSALRKEVEACSPNRSIDSAATWKARLVCSSASPSLASRFAARPVGRRPRAVAIGRVPNSNAPLIGVSQSHGSRDGRPFRR